MIELKNTNTNTIERGNEMAFDKVKYIDEWNKANVDRVTFKIPKGEKEKLDALAKRAGKSTTRFIKDALRYYIDALGEEEINLG